MSRFTNTDFRLHSPNHEKNNVKMDAQRQHKLLSAHVKCNVDMLLMLHVENPKL